MWKKVLLLAAVTSLAAVVAKKVKTVSDDRELWREATTSSDKR